MGWWTRGRTVRDATRVRARRARVARAAMVGCVLVAMPPDARGAGEGTVLRAVGWFKGKAEITAGRISCEIPEVQSAISEGSFTLGLWNTYGTQTIEYPDPAN